MADILVNYLLVNLNTVDEVTHLMRLFADCCCCYYYYILPNNKSPRDNRLTFLLIPESEFIEIDI